MITFQLINYNDRAHNHSLSFGLSWALSYHHTDCEALVDDAADPDKKVVIRSSDAAFGRLASLIETYVVHNEEEVPDDADGLVVIVVRSEPEVTPIDIHVIDKEEVA